MNRKGYVAVQFTKIFSPLKVELLLFLDRSSFEQKLVLLFFDLCHKSAHIMNNLQYNKGIQKAG